jgi:hypothetical protein
MLSKNIWSHLLDRRMGAVMRFNYSIWERLRRRGLMYRARRGPGQCRRGIHTATTGAIHQAPTTEAFPILILQEHNWV